MSVALYALDRPTYEPKPDEREILRLWLEESRKWIERLAGQLEKLPSTGAGEGAISDAYSLADNLARLERLADDGELTGGE